MTAPMKIEGCEVKSVLVIYVGGTIGMEKNKNNVYSPSPNKLVSKLKCDSQMHNIEMAQHYFPNLQSNQLVLPEIDSKIVLYQIKEYYPLLDSSNMSATDWIRIAKDIETDYCYYDGFVILHGTDTLAYTSSALSFMLDGLEKPVILTGSQISIFAPRSDARDNMLAALILAGCYNIPEVSVFFANKLLRGNRTAKISSTLLNAFDSPNYVHLAEVGVEITVNKHMMLQPKSNQFNVYANLCPNVAVLSFFPTIKACLIKALIECPSVEGLVLQSYGAGNIPTNEQDLIEVIKHAVDNEILIVNITQCAQGAVSTIYESGLALEKIGVIPGYDMTLEAALTKLCYVLGIPDLTYNTRVLMMHSNLRGELTNNNNNSNILL